MKKLLSISLILLTLLTISFGQNTYKIAILKYNGGGDWYANPTALPNLIDFCNQNIKTNIKKEPATVEVGSKEIFNYPFIHMTGHGNVIFRPPFPANPSFKSFEKGKKFGKTNTLK